MADSIAGPAANDFMIRVGESSRTIQAPTSPSVGDALTGATNLRLPFEDEEITRAYPVIEIFGPTVQGEGRMVGAPCHFVRFGGCDYRCGYAHDARGRFKDEPTGAFVCDSLYAVLPGEVRKNSTRMNSNAIMTALGELPGAPKWVILSGGNPALHDLEPLIRQMHLLDLNVAIETQGSKYKPWFRQLDLLTLSPKPPSSHMVTNWEILDRIIYDATIAGVDIDLKIVIFTQDDREYARRVHRQYPKIPMYLSTGTVVGKSTRDDLLDRMRDTIEWALRDPDMADVCHGFQLHVALWGHGRGF